MKRTISVALIFMAGFFVGFFAFPANHPGDSLADDLKAAIASNQSTAASESTLSASASTPSAAEYIESQLAQFDRVLYVFKDNVDGANHFPSKAFIGYRYDHIPVTRDDAVGLDGTTGILATIDLSKNEWGGYMFANGVLNPGDRLPSPDFGKSEAGLNLTGAEKLTFYAKGQTGDEVVEFFVAGLGHSETGSTRYADTARKRSLGQVRLSSDWKQYTINLASLDLSRIGCGFGWVARQASNNKAPITFFLDDIRYEFKEPRPGPYFLASYAPAAPGTDQAIINNFAYLYDNAAAVLALSYAGKHERARQLAEAIVYAVNNDRYFSDGRIRNAYMSGDPRSFPGWKSPKGKEFARSPGFYDYKTAMFYEDASAMSTSTGNCAWAMLALMEVYSEAPSHKEFLEATLRLADFVLTLGTEVGFTGGYEGFDSEQVKVSYKSTEHNADLVAAFGRLAKLTNQAKYAEASAKAKAFVLSMYDSEKGLFYTGTGPDGLTPNRTVIPLDAQTWTLSVLGHEFKDTGKVLAYLEEHLAVDGGYDFDADSKDGVWNEGTAQVGVLYRLVGDNKNAERILKYLNAHRLPDGSVTSADRNVVSKGFIFSNMVTPWNYYNR
ncbi:MAG: hypothetical protein LBS44_04110, partial [Deltaproteobacteria bacterium]|nr:hypothetical protein [Deltaproteobacteria bacterium]